MRFPGEKINSSLGFVVGFCFCFAGRGAEGVMLMGGIGAGNGDVGCGLCGCAWGCSDVYMMW